MAEKSQILGQVMTDPKNFSQKLTFQLLEMHKERRGGILRAERGTSKKQLVVRQGRLSFAESNAPGDHLARVMVSMNLLPKSALPGIAAAMREKKTSDEAILATSKASIRELEEGAREQALAVLSSLMEWDAGEMRIYSSEQSVRRQFDLALPLPDFIVAAARRAAARRPIPSAFSPLKGSLSPVEENLEALLILPLDRTEAFAFSLVTQSVPVESLLLLLAPEHPKPEDLLLRLLMLGLVRRQESMPAAVAVEPDPSSELEVRLDEMLRRSEPDDLYTTLAVATDAGEQQIKEAYHALAKQYHPDRFQSGDFSEAFRGKAEKLFTRITGAYSTLTDPSSRSAYDRGRLKGGAAGDAPLKGRSAMDLDRENMAEVLFRAGQGFFAKGDFEKAVEKLKECAWLKPEVPKYPFLLGAAQAEIPKMRKEAEQNLLKAIELDRSMTDAHLALGKLYLRVGMTLRAEAQLREALRSNPNNAEAGRLLQEIESGERPSR